MGALRETTSESEYGRVVELVDSLDSGSSVHCGRAGSSPASPTKIKGHPFGCPFIFYVSYILLLRQKVRRYFQSEMATFTYSLEIHIFILHSDWQMQEFAMHLRLHPFVTVCILPPALRKGRDGWSVNWRQFCVWQCQR